MQDQINLFFQSLELSSTGYTVSFCRDELNNITDINFDNCQIKSLLMKQHHKSLMAAVLARLAILYVIKVFIEAWIIEVQVMDSGKGTLFSPKERINLSTKI